MSTLTNNVYNISIQFYLIRLILRKNCSFLRFGDFWYDVRDCTHSMKKNFKKLEGVY